MSPPQPISDEEWQRMIADDVLEEENYRATEGSTVYDYYYAEETAREDFDTEPLASSEEVVPFLNAALEAAGYTEGPELVVLFDVADDSDKSGYVNNDGIHLHPKLLNPWTLLHELAHWLDPRFGHSPRWAFTYAELVTAVIGQEAGDALKREFDARGLPYHFDDSALWESLLKPPPSGDNLVT